MVERGLPGHLLCQVLLTALCVAAEEGRGKLVGTSSTFTCCIMVNLFDACCTWVSQREVLKFLTQWTKTWCV